MSLEPCTPALPLPTRQHIGWLCQVYHEVLLISAQARQMAACPQMWHQLALSANAVVDKYNTLLLDYFDGYDVWFEDGIEYAWHPDCAHRGAMGVQAVVEKYPLGYLTQLDFELRQTRRYMQDHQAETVLLSSSLERFMLLSASIKRFLDIFPEDVPALLMSDVALAYRYIVTRSLTGGLDGDSIVVSESQRTPQSVSSPMDEVTANLDGVRVSDPLSDDEDADELDYVLLDVNES